MSVRSVRSSGGKGRSDEVEELKILAIFTVSLEECLVNLKKQLDNVGQFVKCEGFTSSKFQIRGGVPQGSNLGHLLFLLFVNDLPNTMSCCKLIFVDDLKIYTDTDC